MIEQGWLRKGDGNVRGGGVGEGQFHKGNITMRQLGENTFLYVAFST